MNSLSRCFVRIVTIYSMLTGSYALAVEDNGAPQNLICDEISGVWEGECQRDQQTPHPSSIDITQGGCKDITINVLSLNVGYMGTIQKAGDRGQELSIYKSQWSKDGKKLVVYTNYITSSPRSTELKFMHNIVEYALDGNRLSSKSTSYVETFDPEGIEVSPKTTQRCLRERVIEPERKTKTVHPDELFPLMADHAPAPR